MTLDNTLIVLCKHQSSDSLLQVMLYNIRRVRPYLTQEAAQFLIQALIMSRLEYCNSPHHTPATYPECCSPLGFQPFQVLPCHPAPPLASSRRALPLQDHDAYLQSSKRNCPALPSGYAQTLQPKPSTPCCHRWSLGPPTPKGGQLLLSPVQSLFWHPNGRASFHLKLPSHEST